MTNDVRPIRPNSDLHSGPDPRKKNGLLRNSTRYVPKLPRFVQRMNATDRDYFERPPIIANSFPNCDGQLLSKIVRVFPATRHYGNFISSMPTIPFRERTDIAHDRMIRRLVPGEIAGAHIFFNENHAHRIAARNGVHFFLYRDLRDVAVAEAHYLTHVNFWHRLHPFFAALKNDEERILAAIRGLRHARFPYNYPDIAVRFGRYEGWLKCRDVLAVAREDLHEDRIADTARRMVGFYASRCRLPVEEDALVDSICHVVRREAAPMRRRTGPVDWTTAFTVVHHRQFEETAGAMNRKLGYDALSPRPLSTSGAGPRHGATVITPLWSGQTRPANADANADQEAVRKTHRAR